MHRKPEDEKHQPNHQRRSPGKAGVVVRTELRYEGSRVRPSDGTAYCRIAQRCLDAFEKGIDLIFVVTPVSPRRFREGYVANIFRSNRGPGICLVGPRGAVLLGQLAFQLGDALFGSSRPSGHGRTPRPPYRPRWASTPVSVCVVSWIELSCSDVS